MAGRQAVTRRRWPRHVPEPPAGTVRATARSAGSTPSTPRAGWPSA
jgi:hypothetical protein